MTCDFTYAQYTTLPVMTMNSRTQSKYIISTFSSSHYRDPLSILDRGSLLTLCVSLFRGIAALYHGALIDINGMFEAKEAEIRVLRRVAFEYEVRLEPHQQPMCACLLKHISGRSIYNIAFRELFYVSLGRKPNSLFAYRRLGAPDFVKLIFTVENYDFESLRSYEPIETQVPVIQH